MRGLRYDGRRSGWWGYLRQPYVIGILHIQLLSNAIGEVAGVRSALREGGDLPGERVGARQAGTPERAVLQHALM
jgi:hypothetical protein